MTKAEHIRGFFKTRLPLILGIYILIQPLLDVLTAPTANAGFPVSVGVVVRTLFMAVAFLYVLFLSQFKERKFAVAYLGALVVYLILFMGLMFALGGLALCLSNLRDLARVFFVPFVGVFLLAIYREYGYKISSRSIAWAGGLYAFVILLAYVTGTSMVSYRSGFGFKGWFYAANEVGCIIAIAAPIALWYCMKVLPTVTKRTWWKGVLIALALISIVFAADFIGTKIIFAAVLLFCVLACLWYLVRAIRARSRWDAVAAVIAGVMAAAIVGLFFVSPLNGYLDNVYLDMIDQTSEEVMDHWSSSTPGEPVPGGPELVGLMNASEGTWLRELVANDPVVQRLDQLLSRRLITASPAVQEFIDGSVAIKLLGIGYADTGAFIRETSRQVELDGLSLLVRNGILGFLLYFIPYLLGVLYLIVQFFRRPLKRLASLKYCAYLYAALIAFAIAMFAGHVLGAPAVGIFMLAATVNVFLLTRRQNRGEDIDTAD